MTHRPAEQTRSRAIRPTQAVGPRLERLLRELSSQRRILRSDELAASVARYKLSASDVATFLALAPDHYAHREVYRSEYLEVGCIGWRSGQHSPIHDHDGSACCVLVLRGVLSNLEYEQGMSGAVVPRGVRQLRAGELLTYGGSEIHRMANEQPALDLFTFHVYSPPLAPIDQRVRGETSPARSATPPGA